MADKELKAVHRVDCRRRAGLLSSSTLHRTWDRANSEQRLTSGWRDSILTGWIFPCWFWRAFIGRVQVVYYFKAFAHVVSHDFTWLATGECGCMLLIYSNYGTTKQRSGHLLRRCTHISPDSALLQKAGTTHLRTAVCPVLMCFVLALGHLRSFLLPTFTSKTFLKSYVWYLYYHKNNVIFQKV